MHLLFILEGQLLRNAWYNLPIMNSLFIFINNYYIIYFLIYKYD